MKDPSHRLHHMIPVKRNLGNGSYPKYELPKCKTERYKNSFILWYLFNCQSEVVIIKNPFNLISSNSVDYVVNSVHINLYQSIYNQ